MRSVIASIEGEYRRYRRLGERVVDQLDDTQLATRPGPESNSVATIVWHLAGNLESRFTDFLDADGEKPWRDREGEFAPREADASAVRARWARGFEVLLDALAALDDGDLGRTVTIRGQALSVLEALQRSLAHTSYHVGQMTYVGKMLRGAGWTYLSIPPGGTDAYNAAPGRERPPGPGA